MRELKKYQEISEILGDDSLRFFSNGYRNVVHKLEKLEFDSKETILKGGVAIEYTKSFSVKNGKTQQPHLTTLDALMISNYSCIEINRVLFEGDIEEIWVSKLKISSGNQHTDELDQLSFSTKLKELKIAADGYIIIYETVVNNMKVQLEMVANCELKGNIESFSREEQVILQEAHFGQKLLSLDVEVRENLIDIKDQYIISLIEITKSTIEYYDIFSMFLSMTQQAQALLYKYDDLSREETNNLWMREIEMSYEKRFITTVPFYQKAELVKPKILKMKDGSVWRTGLFDLSILNNQNLYCRAKIAHQLPTK